MAMGTNHHLTALNKIRSYVAPWGPIPIFFQGKPSSIYLQTFLLDDHWSKAKGLGAYLCLSIKSASKIYYI